MKFDDFTNDIVVNIVVGCGTFILGVLWNLVLVPAYQSKVYSGIKVEGKWSVELSHTSIDGKEFTVRRRMEVDLFQSAQTLSGTANSLVLEGDADTIEYKVRGRIKDRLITLDVINVDQSRLAHSVFLLEVTGDGRRMEGIRSFYSLKTSKIDCATCTWRKSL